MYMIRKKQIQGIEKGDVVTKVKFITQVFGVGVAA
jgi:hypothetical protein